MVRGGRGSVVPRRTGGEGREFPHPTKMAGNPFGMSPRTRVTIPVGTWGRKGKNTGKTTARGRAGAPSVRRRSKTGRPGGSTLKMRMTRKGKETNHGWTQRGRVATKRIGTQGDSQAGKQETQEHRKTSKWGFRGGAGSALPGFGQDCRKAYARQMRIWDFICVHSCPLVVDLDLPALVFSAISADSLTIPPLEMTMPP